MDNKRYLKSLHLRELQYLAGALKVEGRKRMGYKELVTVLKEFENIQDLPRNQSHTYTVGLLDYWDRSLQGTIENPTHTHELTNKACDDWVKIEAVITNNVFTDIQFVVGGCCLSECCAAIIVEEMRGKSLEYLANYTNEDFRKRTQVKVFSYREACVTLGLDCLRLFNEEA